MTQTETEILTAPHVLEYPYKRSLGPVIGRFFTSLKQRRIEGVRTAMRPGHRAAGGVRP